MILEWTSTWLWADLEEELLEGNIALLELEHHTEYSRNNLNNGSNKEWAYSTHCMSECWPCFDWLCSLTVSCWDESKGCSDSFCKSSIHTLYKMLSEGDSVIRLEHILSKLKRFPWSTLPPRYNSVRMLAQVLIRFCMYSTSANLLCISDCAVRRSGPLHALCALLRVEQHCSSSSSSTIWHSHRLHHEPFI